MKNRYFIAFLVCANLVFAQQYTKIIVKFKENQRIDEAKNYSAIKLSSKNLSELDKAYIKHKVISALKASKIESEKLNKTYIIKVADSANAAKLIKILNKLPMVEWAEEAPVYEAFTLPNDIHPNQWHLNKINASEAWQLTTGVSSVIIAIVDDAVRITHEDLAPAIWTNPNEIPNNNIDDDANGYIDDINGYDVANGDNNPNPPAFASNNIFTHGTHCAGIAAASSNNGLGIASIGYSVKIIPVKSKLDATSDNTLSAVYEGVEYAIAAGATVISMSWGGTRYYQSFQELFDVAAAKGIILVAAAGNSNTSQPMYPASYNHVISVGATDANDVRASFSNYGSTVDIMAPGVSIWSSLAGSASAYGYLSGTSMA